MRLVTLGKVNPPPGIHPGCPSTFMDMTVSVSMDSTSDGTGEWAECSEPPAGGGGGGCWATMASAARAGAAGGKARGANTG